MFSLKIDNLLLFIFNHCAVYQNIICCYYIVIVKEKRERKRRRKEVGFSRDYIGDEFQFCSFWQERIAISILSQNSLWKVICGL